MITTVAAQAYTLPPLMGKQSIATLLGVPVETVDDWRAQALAEIRAGRAPDLPVPDRVVDNRPLWLPGTILDWAVAGGRLPADHGLLLPDPDIVLWSQQDIATHFGVNLSTVRERWRYHFTHAVLHELPIPAKALVAEDFMIDGIPFWRPETVITWGRKVGKLGLDGKPLQRKGLKWVAEPVAQVTVVDPVDELIAAGQLWDWAAIAGFFGVRIKTVKMWASPHSSGQGFPDPDGDRKRNGHPTWKPETVKTWARDQRRLGSDDKATPVRGGPRPGTRRPPRGAAPAAAKATSLAASSRAAA